MASDELSYTDRTHTNDLLKGIRPAKANRPKEPVSVLARHHVRWDCEDAYLLWLEKSYNTMRFWPGFVSFRAIAPNENDDENPDEVRVLTDASIVRVARLWL